LNYLGPLKKNERKGRGRRTSTGGTEAVRALVKALLGAL